MTWDEWVRKVLKVYFGRTVFFQRYYAKVVEANKRKNVISNTKQGDENS